ncbi:MAG: hypothetical protein EAZ18_26935 [Oscillatoriales cyanobacterium]|nr:MAG: hypothetical protein EAZ18_26935 [Oscillatoriales cyanobacterium]
MWFSVNPKTERAEVVEAAMLLSGEYKNGWSECGEFLETYPLADELHPNEVAYLYNNADALGLDIYTVGVVGKDAGDLTPDELLALGASSIMAYRGVDENTEG